MAEPIALAMSLQALNPPTAGGRGSPALQGKSPAQLRKACAEMESLFLDQLFKEMRKTIPKTGFMHGGRAEEIYTSMLDSHVARELSAARGIGLASLLEVQLRGRMASSEDESAE
jgi:flagellar protein FlgJ